MAGRQLAQNQTQDTLTEGRLRSLLADFSSPDFNVSDRAWRELYQFRNNRLVVPALTERVLHSSQNDNARTRAIDFLRVMRSGDERAIRAICAALHDASPVVRMSAVDAIGELSGSRLFTDPDEGRNLRSVYTKDLRPLVVTELSRAFVEEEGRAGWVSQEHLKGRIIDAIIAVGGRAAENALEGLAGNWSLRPSDARLVVAGITKSALNESGSSAVRDSAVRFFIQLTSDLDERMRKNHVSYPLAFRNEIITALGTLGGPEAKSELEDRFHWFHTHDDHTRSRRTNDFLESLVQALGNVGSRVPIVEAAFFEGERTQVRIAWIGALTAIGGRDALAILTRISLSDDDNEIREKASASVNLLLRNSKPARRR